MAWLYLRTHYWESHMDRKALKEMLAEEGLTAKEAASDKTAADAYRSYQFEQKKALRAIPMLLNVIHSSLVWRSKWDEDETGDKSSFDDETYDYIEKLMRDIESTVEDI